MLNLIENTKPYINTRLGEPLTDREKEMLSFYQQGKYPYYPLADVRSLIAKGYVELKSNEIWLTQLGEEYDPFE